MNAPSIAIVGSGVIGTAFGVLMRQHGSDVTTVTGRQWERIMASAARIGCTPSASVEQAARSAPWILVAVPDDVIGHVGERIAAVWRESLPPDAAVIHCSGARGTEALAAVEAVGAATGVCHPLASMMNLEAALEWLPRACFGISGTDSGHAFAQHVALHISGSFVELDDKRRALYHAGACVAAGYLTALLDMASGLLMDGAGFTPHETIQALSPLIDSTIENIRRYGTTRALTGPVARGDVGTIQRHLEEMERRQVPERWFRMYRTLGDAALELAEARGMDAASAAAVRQVLRGDAQALPKSSNE